MPAHRTLRGTGLQARGRIPPLPAASDDTPLPGGWTSWDSIAPAFRVEPHLLTEILDGGQSFRWHRSPAGGESSSEVAWTGTWSDCVAQLRLAGASLEWRAPAAIAGRVAVSLPDYLAHDLDWAHLADQLPWRSDAHLAGAIRDFPGLRLLRQPFGETLLGFLCSSTKRIVQIKQMLALLAERHGAPLAECVAPDAFGGTAAGSAVQRLPTWPELARVPEKELRGCLLGFRARYISETARFLATHPGWLEETGRLPYLPAKARLMELPGVGEKVADCVLLYGAGRLEAFPVDTWILKSLERRYGLAGWRPAQLAQFGRSHFGPLAGLAQQYLFAWERREGRR